MRRVRRPRRQGAARERSRSSAAGAAAAASRGRRPRAAGAGAGRRRRAGSRRRRPTSPLDLLRAVDQHPHGTGARRAASAGRSRARPARPTTRPTPGSSASRRRSRPACGSASTEATCSARARPAAAPRSRSGSTSCRSALAERPDARLRGAGAASSSRASTRRPACLASPGAPTPLPGLPRRHRAARKPPSFRPTPPTSGAWSASTSRRASRAEERRQLRGRGDDPLRAASRSSASLPDAPGDADRGEAERPRRRHVVVSIADQRRAAAGGDAERAPGRGAPSPPCSPARPRASGATTWPPRSAGHAEALKDRHGELQRLRGWRARAPPRRRARRGAARCRAPGASRSSTSR